MTKNEPRPPGVAESRAGKTRARTNSITFKLTLVLILVALLPMTLTVFFNLEGSLRIILREEKRNLQLLATNIAGRLDQLIIDTRNVVNFVASDPNVVRLLGTSENLHEAHHHAAHDLLDRVQDASGNFSDVFILNRHGTIVASNHRNDIGLSAAFRRYYKASKRGEHYTSNLLVSYSGELRGQTGVFFAAPVYEGTSIVGAAVVMLASSAMNSVLVDLERTSSEIKVFLVDKDGIVVVDPEATGTEGNRARTIVDSNRSWLYRSLAQLPPLTIEQIQHRSRFPVDTIECLCIPELAKVLVSPTSSGTQSYHAPDSGELRFVGYSPMKQSRLWTVGVDEPRAIFTAPIEQLAYHGLITSALIGIGTLLLAAILGRRLVHPLRSLTEATHKLKNRDPGESGPLPDAAAAGTLAYLPGRFRLDEDSKAELARISTSRRDEIGTLAQAFADMAEKLQEYIKDLKAVTAANERVESEMKIAGDIQLSFMVTDFTAPNARLELDLYAVVHPAKHAGGDLYDFFFVDDEHLFFVIGDVSDKGMPAALFMAVTLTLIRNLVRRDVPPDKILDDINRFLCRNNDAYQFVTLFCGLLHLPSGEVHYSHGGHNPPYLVSPSTGELRPLKPVSGVALGVFDSAEYKTETLTMAPGDVLFTYSDGITEAMDPDHELFGEPRLEAILRRLGPNEAAETASQTVLTELMYFVGDAPQSDDITALCIRFVGQPGRR